MVFLCFRCKFLNFYSLNSILVVTNLVQSFVLNQRRLMEWRGYYIRNLGCYYATGGCVPASRILVLGMDDVRSCDYDLEVQLLWCMYSSCLEPHEVVCYFNKEKVFHVSYCCSNIWEDEKNGVKVGNGVAAARIVCVSCQSQAKLLCECYLAKFFSGLHM
jgi:hypothetical protein